MDLKTKIRLSLVSGFSAILLVTSVNGGVLNYTDDFSDWTRWQETTIHGWEFPNNAWFDYDNADSLKWNLTVNTGSPAEPRWLRYEIRPVLPITQIEFDWRFANGQLYSRLVFELWDDNGNILWAATSTLDGQPHPWNFDETISIPGGTDSLSFVYFNKVNGNMTGKPGLFESNFSDWDANIDNVTVTIEDTCAEKLPGDANGDCFVDLDDAVIIAAGWLACSHPDPLLCN
jgi:hypothetical protein